MKKENPTSFISKIETPKGWRRVSREAIFKPKRGKPPQIIPQGWYRDPSDPFIALLEIPDCLDRMEKVDASCGTCMRKWCDRDLRQIDDEDCHLCENPTPIPEDLENSKDL